MKGNAFWREVIDHLPNMLLIFRVDEKEEAHLIFVNNKVSEQLGYTAKEYVLNSETDADIKAELQVLIDEVARRSHDVDELKPRASTLTDKQGDKNRYEITFRLFTTSSQKSNLIAVELFPAQDKEEPVAKPELTQPKSLLMTEDSAELIASSKLMQQVLNKAETLVKGADNMLIRGEQSVGKRTLIRYLIRNHSSLLGKIFWFHPNHDQFIEVDENHTLIVIPEIRRLSSSQQENLLALLNRNPSLRVIATSSKPLEQLVEDDKFDPELFYTLSFNSILVPPLRQRQSDVKEAAKRFIRSASDILKIESLHVEEGEYDKLERHEWEGNYDELFEVLRSSLTKAENGVLTFYISTKKQSSLFPEQDISPDEILFFDDMIRRYLSRILEITGGKIYGDDGAAKILGLKPTTLQSKLKKLGLR